MVDAAEETIPDREDARVAYQMAVAMYTYEGSLIWARFNAMLVAQSLILAAITVLLTGSRDPTAPFLLQRLPVLLSVVGILVSILLLEGLIRGFRYQDAFLRRAQAIDQAYLTVHILPIRPEPRKNRWPLGETPIRQVVYITVILFVFLYACTAVIGSF